MHKIKIKSKTGMVPDANDTMDANNTVFVLEVQGQVALKVGQTRFHV